MIKQALHNLKIDALNEMQQTAIAAASKGDLILLSPTGSGKTLGFLLPLLSSLDANVSTVQAMILAPSRELALQIEQVFKVLGSGFKVNCCYGGHAVKTEINNLSQPPAVLIGTPGRIAHHLRRKSFDPAAVSTLVLDEFDKALEFGFQEDMAYIIKQLPFVKKRMLTSATRMDEIPAFTGISNPLTLDYLSDAASAPDLEQKAVITDAARRLDALFALVCQIGDQPTLVFCNHRDAVERISDLLWDKGLPHDIFHGGMDQDDRERALIKFRNGSHRILITTDLASRGLDIPEIAHVIHYQLPQTEEAFLHRNGRTARMHAKGTSYLLLAPGEKPDYLGELPAIEDLPQKAAIPSPSPWATLYIAAGKKDKINKVDIVGLLLKKGKLAKEDLGLIEVLDHSSYAAVARDQIERVAKLVKDEKMKGRKIKIEVSR
ncbi:ATP-independent RNA helicase DbpA [Anseongella ginsenosidimutans]|uniref:ATP-independent RNA helicase DbpA n=1 Tax=Anseongella ginsenosidimutans TaxID=496056 RepID=A0A4R3KNF5_9SPHI|nr:DEAD/DEAH box helicase [Anseongella ginsenosidimutans]QEC53723.1 DEAD/DEAH box helicase [Anseongella ginsenosidimutans]TCS86023.1 ATP-independent RNA helicase DbpA [Anseongella ginsenosidimutans]